ncbi:hypothetical protein M885DRAFT_613884 [Pelagophyceae sp. CCMP2097]|nr:hypothetical protein M885DRAFT_613884 [Pelagophyceae sp. CCMP2097]
MRAPLGARQQPFCVACCARIVLSPSVSAQPKAALLKELADILVVEDAQLVAATVDLVARACVTLDEDGCVDALLCVARRLPSAASLETFLQLATHPQHVARTRGRGVRLVAAAAAARSRPLLPRVAIKILFCALADAAHDVVADEIALALDHCVAGEENASEAAALLVEEGGGVAARWLRHLAGGGAVALALTRCLGALTHAVADRGGGCPEFYFELIADERLLQALHGVADADGAARRDAASLVHALARLSSPLARQLAVCGRVVPQLWRGVSRATFVGDRLPFLEALCELGARAPRDADVAKHFDVSLVCETASGACDDSRVDVAALGLLRMALAAPAAAGSVAPAVLAVLRKRFCSDVVTKMHEEDVGVAEWRTCHALAHNATSTPRTEDGARVDGVESRRLLACVVEALVLGALHRDALQASAPRRWLHRDEGEACAGCAMVDCIGGALTLVKHDTTLRQHVEALLTALIPRCLAAGSAEVCAGRFVRTLFSALSDCTAQLRCAAVHRRLPELLVALVARGGLDDNVQLDCTACYALAVGRAVDDEGAFEWFARQVTRDADAAPATQAAAVLCGPASKVPLQWAQAKRRCAAVLLLDACSREAHRDAGGWRSTIEAPAGASALAALLEPTAMAALANDGALKDDVHMLVDLAAGAELRGHAPAQGVLDRLVDLIDRDGLANVEAASFAFVARLAKRTDVAAQALRQSVAAVAPADLRSAVLSFPELVLHVAPDGAEPDADAFVKVCTALADLQSTFAESHDEQQRAAATNALACVARHAIPALRRPPAQRREREAVELLRALASLAHRADAAAAAPYVSMLLEIALAGDDNAALLWCVNAASLVAAKLETLHHTTLRAAVAAVVAATVSIPCHKVQLAALFFAFVVATKEDASASAAAPCPWAQILGSAATMLAETDRADVRVAACWLVAAVLRAMPTWPAGADALPLQLALQGRVVDAASRAEREAAAAALLGLVALIDVTSAALGPWHNFVAAFLLASDHISPAEGCFGALYVAAVLDAGLLKLDADDAAAVVARCCGGAPLGSGTLHLVAAVARQGGAATAAAARDACADRREASPAHPKRSCALFDDVLLATSMRAWLRPRGDAGDRRRVCTDPEQIDRETTKAYILRQCAV